MTAGLAYGFVAITGMAEPAATWPWLLRQPAAAAVGSLALIALPEHWWQAATGDGTRGWWVFIMLLAASCGYLLLEAVNHRISGVFRLMGLILLVLGIGLMHALTVAVVTLRWTLPAFAAKGNQFAQLWTPQTADALSPVLIVCLATAWSLASGVFLQSLWQDQPITAPLGHVEWRAGR